MIHDTFIRPFRFFMISTLQVTLTDQRHKTTRHLLQLGYLPQPIYVRNIKHIWAGKHTRYRS